MEALCRQFDDRQDPAEFALGTQRGVSAELCTRLAQVLSIGGDFEFRLRFAIDAPEALDPRPIRFLSRHQRALGEAATALRAARPIPVEVTGQATNLGWRSTNSDEENRGVFDFRITSPTSHAGTVRASVEPEVMKAEVIPAFAEERKIRLAGELFQRGNSRFLTGASFVGRGDSMTPSELLLED